jgi:ubiquinone/menaquinone biosynthesis C-methylase UbiE
MEPLKRPGEMTRWQKFYLDDSCIASVPPSNFSRKAADIFTGYHKQKILDLACGIGRDSFYLADHSLHFVVGDLARSGLEIAKQLPGVLLI